MEKNQELVKRLRAEAEKQECPAELRQMCQSAADEIEKLCGVVEDYHFAMLDMFRRLDLPEEADTCVPETDCHGPSALAMTEERRGYEC